MDTAEREASYRAQAEHYLADSIGVCKALGVKLVLAAFFGRGELDMKDAKAIDHVVEAIQRVPARATAAESGLFSSIIFPFASGATS